jgi:4-amino-4-deoxy-L-arabinose transferase-like glycosyltransferase
MTASSITEISPTRRYSRLWLEPRGIAALVCFWILIRWVVAVYRQLVPDEAYYWVWSRHLALSYFDHPPMVAYLIRASTLIFGDTTLGVRWLAGPVVAAGAGLLFLATRSVIGGHKAAAFVPLALLLSPLCCVMGAVVTPDTPVFFFQSAALACAIFILAPGEHASEPARGKWWLLFGVFMGLALDSKYTAVLLGAAVFLGLLFSADGQKHLRTAWPWLGVVCAVAAFSPVIIWNYRHDWGSFRFQLHHGLAQGDSPAWKTFLGYVGGQAAVCTPVLFVMCIAVLVMFWRRKNKSAVQWVLIWSGTVPLLFFAYSALHKRVEANWPMFAYPPCAILVAIYLAENWNGRRVFWAEASVKIAVMAAIALHFPEAALAISPNLSTPQWDNTFGWTDLATKVDSVREDSPVLTGDYEYASELTFYLPNHPDVRPFHDDNRLTAFDFFPPGPQDGHRWVLVRRLPRDFTYMAPWNPLGGVVQYDSPEEFLQYEKGRLIRRSQIETASQ